MKQHEAWLDKAVSDLESSKKLIEGDNPITDTAVYHTQQCAEKALKAFLSYKKQALEKTHDIQLLLEICLEHDPTFEDIYEDGIMLNPFATLFRYPGILHKPDLEHVKEAIIKADRILNFVKMRII